jgi:hypothetical protein
MNKIIVPLGMSWWRKTHTSVAFRMFWWTNMSQCFPQDVPVFLSNCSDEHTHVSAGHIHCFKMPACYLAMIWTLATVLAPVFIQIFAILRPLCSEFNVLLIVICSLFNDSVSNLDSVATKDGMINMINALERIWKKWSWHNFGYYSSTCLEELRQTMKTISQDSWSMGWDLNLELPEYSAGLLTSWPWCSVN